MGRGDCPPAPLAGPVGDALRLGGSRFAPQARRARQQPWERFEMPGDNKINVKTPSSQGQGYPASASGNTGSRQGSTAAQASDPNIQPRVSTSTSIAPKRNNEPLKVVTRTAARLDMPGFKSPTFGTNTYDGVKALYAGRTVPPRHQTLRAIMDWSHQLLDADEVTLFRRLAVFVGGFALDVVRGRILHRERIGPLARHITINPGGRTLWIALGPKARELAIVDVSETGGTLRAHGMKVIDTLLESDVLLIANPAAAADPEKRRAMDDVTTLLLGALRAQGRVLIRLNVSEARLKELLDVLPAMKAPTVSPLAEEGNYAVETVVEKSAVNTLIPLLKAHGASDILELPISKIVP